jgi:hypothetical protein
MILHFVIDGKLTDQIIENYLAVSEKNFFLVFGMKGDMNYQRINKTGDFLGRFTETDDINSIIEKLNAKAIILHSLSYDYAKTVIGIRKEITICWVVWGYDLYFLPKIEPLIYAKKTSEFLKRKYPMIVLKRKIIRSDKLRNYYYRIFNWKQDKIRTILLAQEKIKYFLTYIREDFDIYSNYYPNRFKFLYGTVSSIDQYLAGDKNLSIFSDANNILIGNSFSPSSNYLDVLPVIARNIQNFDKVYIVLSYGNNEKHKKFVIKRASKLLIDHFHPLLEFMNRKDYVKILQTCSTGIFFHYRQQAMGNIIAMLYMGSRVYLSSKNPAYKFFIRNNIVVNSLEEEFEQYGFSRLNIDIVKQNQQHLDMIFSREKVLIDLRNVTETLVNT